MAKNNPNTIEMPVIDLPKEQVEQIDNLAADLERAERELNALEKMGVGVTALRERLAWAKGVRDVLLTEFGGGEKETK